MAEIETPPSENIRSKLGKSLIKKGEKLHEIAAEKAPLKNAAVILGLVGVTEMAIALGASLNADQLSHLGEQLIHFDEHRGAALLFGKSAESSSEAVKWTIILATQLAALAGIELKNQTLTNAYVNDFDRSIPKSTHAVPVLGNIFIAFGERLVGNKPITSIKQE